ncbi:tripartite tricarboxylate transporter TctB family protein [Jiella pelagia]|uniref:Tripartite tricarboxylate transporter TctB family protein n=1 Tax=Jiella pelagia TaxID=2986949 RepID=A0ABY7BUE1_9HYPH|nr:tripartite tricarboxylate transporter TctB family protein [Jiella pelagia]WAP66902.1 tripartite tricarboxylate transporter TctB family protein [Jiella pelagia]
MRYAFCGLLVLLSAALVWQALQLSGPASVYPLVVTSGALLFSLSYTVMRVVGGFDDGASSFEIPRATIARVAGFVAVWLAYVLLLPTGGFILTTWLALLVSLAIVRGRLGLVDALATALFVAVLAVLMKTVLYVPVPQGWLDESLETLLYRLR